MDHKDTLLKSYIFFMKCAHQELPNDNHSSFSLNYDVPLALTETSAGEKPLQMDKWVKGPLVQHVTSTSGPRLGFLNSTKLAFGILKSAPGMEGKLRKRPSTRTIFGFHN